MRPSPKSDESNYRFEHLNLLTILKDMYFSDSDPAPGEPIPQFDLPLLGGGSLRASDIPKIGPVLLVFGSITCPMTDNSADGLNHLYKIFGQQIKFVLVNVREAHPGSAFPQPRTMSAKIAHAEKLKILHGFEFEVAVDDLDGGLHHALGTKPNSAYILGKEGFILFRAHWANDTEALAQALSEVSTGEPLQFTRSGGIVLPMMQVFRDIAPVLDRAGRGAWKDMWRVAPPMAAMAALCKVIGFSRRE